MYDFKIVEPAENINEKHWKGYTMQKLCAFYDGKKVFEKGGKYCNQWTHEKYYLISVFEIISKLLNVGVCMTDLKPANTLYDGENYSGTLIDLAGVVKKGNRKGLETCKFKYLREVTVRFLCPEMKKAFDDDNQDNEEAFDFCKASSFAFGAIIEEVTLKHCQEASNDPLTAENKKELEKIVLKLKETDPKIRISVEEGLEFCRKLPEGQNIDKVDSEKLMKTILEKTIQEDMDFFGLKSDLLQLDKRFINLFCSDYDPEKNENVIYESLDKIINVFFNQKDCVALVLLGSSGSGKSATLQIKYLQALTQWKKGDSIPVYMNLAVEDNVKERWKWICKAIGLEKECSFSMFSNSRNKYPMVLFLDSFDEAPFKSNFVAKCYEDLGNNKETKIIISCRSEFIQKEEEFAKFFQIRDQKTQKKYIAPLNRFTFDIEMYLKTIDKENSEMLLNKIRSHKLLALMRTGSMVELTLEVLPELVKNNEKQITRSKIYERYIKRKIEKAYGTAWQELLSKEFHLKTQEEFVEFIYGKNLELTSILNKNNQGNRIFTRQGNINDFFRDLSYKADFPCFKNHILSAMIRILDWNVEIKGSVPRENIGLGFSIDSLRVFFLTQLILKEFKTIGKSNSLGSHIIVNEQMFIKYMVEIVQEDEEGFLKMKLKESVLQSKEKAGNFILATNAITILVAANVGFSGEDLSKIRIRNADLSDGLFSYCDFSDADLTNVNLENAKLDHTLFFRTELQGVNFGIFPDIIVGTSITKCSFSPDGYCILSASEDNLVKIWNLHGELLRTCNVGTYIKAASFSHDGLSFVVATNNVVKIFDINGNLTRTFQTNSQMLTSCAFSPDGNLILSASHEGAIFLWEKNSGKFLREYRGHACRVSEALFFPEGTSFVSASYDTTIKIWEVNTGKIIRELKGHTDFIFALAVSLDGNLILSGGVDQILILWDRNTGSPIKAYKEKSIISAVAISPNIDFVMCTSDINSISLYNTSTGKKLKTFQGHTETVQSISFAKDGSKILSGSQDATIKLWNFNKLTSRLKVFPETWHQEAVKSLAFSPDGKYLLSSSQDRLLKLWDRKTMNLIKTYEGLKASANSICFSPDGNYFITGSADFTLQLWDLMKGNILETFEGHTKTIVEVSFSPDSKTVASASHDHTMRIWDLNPKRPRAICKGHLHWVQAVIYSPNAQTLLTGSGDSFILAWDINGNMVKTFKGHDTMVFCLAWCTGTSNFISGCLDSTIKLWEYNTGSVLKTFEGHEDVVSKLFFIPNSWNFVSSSYDRTIKIWDKNTGNIVQTMEGHNGYILGLAISADGGTISSSSDADSCVKIWETKQNDPLSNYQNKKEISDALGQNMLHFQQISNIRNAEMYNCKMTLSTSETKLFCKDMLIIQPSNLSNLNHKILQQQSAHMFLGSSPQNYIYALQFQRSKPQNPDPNSNFSLLDSNKFQDLLAFMLNDNPGENPNKCFIGVKKQAVHYLPGQNMNMNNMINQMSPNQNLAQQNQIQYIQNPQAIFIFLIH